MFNVDDENNWLTIIYDNLSVDNIVGEYLNGNVFNIFRVTKIYETEKTRIYY